MLLAALLLTGAAVSYLLVPRFVPPQETAPQAKHAAQPQASDEGMSGMSDGMSKAKDDEGSGSGIGELADLRRVAAGNVENELGLRITRLTLVADGGLVDLRYQISAPEKASKMLQADRPIYLMNEATGEAVTTATFPKIGELRTNPKGSDAPGRVYFLGFGDPGGTFATGDEVSLISGDYLIEHLEVQ